MKKQKSYLQSFSWVGGMLLAMGAVFLCIALLMQVLPFSPRDVTVSVNGVRQPPTEQTLRTFRSIMLLAFGISALALAIPGGVISVRAALRRKQARRLKEEGICLAARATGCDPSNVRVNGRSLQRLRCAHTDASGATYVFTSGYLRKDPLPHLNGGQVNVYCDPYDMSHYFVDVDESVGLGTRVIEL